MHNATSYGLSEPANSRYHLYSRLRAKKEGEIFVDQLTDHRRTGE